MSDTAKRDAVVERFYAQHYGKPEPLPVVDDLVMDAMADHIVELEAAVERVRAACENDLRWVDAQPILRALEETP